MEAKYEREYSASVDPFTGRVLNMCGSAVRPEHLTDCIIDRATALALQGAWIGQHLTAGSPCKTSLYVTAWRLKERERGRAGMALHDRVLYAAGQAIATNSCVAALTRCAPRHPSDPRPFFLGLASALKRSS